MIITLRTLMPRHAVDILKVFSVFREGKGNQQESENLDEDRWRLIRKTKRWCYSFLFFSFLFFSFLFSFVVVVVVDDDEERRHVNESKDDIDKSSRPVR